MDSHIARVLIDRQRIARRVHELADQIAGDLRVEAGGDGRPPLTLVAVMTGSVIFLADLIRSLPLMMSIRLITVSSYRGKATRAMEARIQGPLPQDLSGQHVVVVDDILDSGQTLELVRRRLEQARPASVRCCVLLRKQTPAARAVTVEYIGFDIPDQFVVGYGLDYNGHYRNLPDVVTLKPEVFA